MPMPAPQDAAALTTQIERHLAQLDALGNSAATAEAHSLVRLLLSLYGTGLSRMLEIVRTERAGPDATLERFAADPLVASLLVLHDLHPVPVAERVARCLTDLQPHLPPETTTRLLGVEGDAVRILFEQRGGARAGGSGLRDAITRAIQEAAPEIARVQIEGLADAQQSLIQIIRRPAPAAVQADS
jgi:hypothetical protein